MNKSLFAELKLHILTKISKQVFNDLSTACFSSGLKSKIFLTSGRKIYNPVRLEPFIHRVPCNKSAG